jgi:hypothetical protein
MDAGHQEAKRFSGSGADDIGITLPDTWRASIVEDVVPRVVEEFVTSVDEEFELPESYMSSIHIDEPAGTLLEHVMRCSKTLSAFQDDRLADTDKVPSAELPVLPANTDWISGNIPWRNRQYFVACGLCYKPDDIRSAVDAVQALKSCTAAAKKGQGVRAARALDAVLISNRFDAALHVACDMHKENERKAAAVLPGPGEEEVPPAAPVGDIPALITACTGMVQQCKAAMNAAASNAFDCKHVYEKVAAMHKDIVAIKEFLRMPGGGHGSDEGVARQWAARGGGGTAGAPHSHGQ